ncbi:MAG: sugar phosphate nucleotidyltransferase, partial [Nitrososphaerota archaeon]
AIQLKPDKILIVVGKYRSMIMDEIEKKIGRIDIIEYVYQEFPLGTGDAVRCTLNQIDGEVDYIILNGDVPLLKWSTIQEIYHYYLAEKSEFLITAIHLKNPTGAGRIIINNGIFEEIVEEKDCSAEQKLITLVNCGIYLCNSSILKKYIPLISNNNAQKEYYLTDLVKIYKEKTGKKVDLYILDSSKELEIFNVNTQEQLSELENRST